MGLAPGTEVDGRYSVAEAVGFGGNGDVYAATDLKTGQRVALKLLFEMAGAKERARLVDEARVMQGLDHPHVLPVHRAGEHRGRVFFAMEYAPHGSLKQAMSAGPYPEEAAIRVAVQVASALSVAHTNGVVHRDVKPANLLLRTPDHVWLADFGVARAAEGSNMTVTGDYLGTIGFMAPEQRVDPRSVVPASDQYGLGATLYALLLGLRGPPPDLYQVDLDDRLLGCRPELIAVLRRCTRPRPADRYADMDALREAVSALE